MLGLRSAVKDQGAVGSSSKQAVARLLGLRSVVKGQRSGVMRRGRWAVTELLGLGPQARTTHKKQQAESVSKGQQGGTAGRNGRTQEAVHTARSLVTIHCCWAVLLTLLAAEVSQLAPTLQFSRLL